MKIKILTDNHPTYEKGFIEVDEDRARYLIAVGVAEEITEKKEKKTATEKFEVKATKEKKEK